MSRTILITGGAGFIGVNTAEYYLKRNEKVIILDNFSRKGTKENIKFLKLLGFKNLEIIKHDVRQFDKKLINTVGKADIIFHLAGQVAVTTSVENPREDFEINALGTLNILESARKSKKNPVLLYSSTNKVYGNLQNLKIVEKAKRYEFKDFSNGVPENFPIDFYSPYGCSKGGAEQYVRDYSRIFGLKTIVFRQSCIYGPHQFGIEDQGWIAWFLIAAMLNKKITIFGDGKQVRDLLYIDDLINAYNLAIKNIKKTNGKIYNIGGGADNTLSVWKELEPILSKFIKKEIRVSYRNERAGDQKIFISDIRKAKEDFNWEPEVKVNRGIENLFDWINKNQQIVKSVNS